MNIQTKEKLKSATSLLFRRFGFNGTSLKQVVEESQVPTGSIYHHYPDGKKQLAAAVIQDNGASYQVLIDLLLDQCPDMSSGLAAVFKSAAKVLEDTQYIDPCPIGGIAREVASTDEALRTAAQQVFEHWTESAAQHFEQDGINPETAKDLAATFIASIEGGFILARTAKSPEPLLRIGRILARTTKREIESV